MWTYVKQSFMSFFYMVFMAVTSYAILLLESKALKIVLAILNVALYVVIVSMAAVKDGEKACKVRYANDLEREMIVATGENRTINYKEEYAPYKGFICGSVTCLPLIVLLVVHTIIILASPATEVTWAGAIASFLYGIVAILFRIDGSAVTKFTPYYSLVAIPLILLATGVPYIIGAMRQQATYNSIKEKERRIRGDKS